MRKIGGWLRGKIVFRKTVLELESLNWMQYWKDTKRWKKKKFLKRDIRSQRVS